MEDYIYIIALIAWVVFAFYRKSQKKNEAAREAQRKAQPRSDSRPMTTLEEILLGKEYIPEEEPETVPTSYTSDGMAPVIGETAFEKEYNLRGITSIEEMDKPFSFKKYQNVDIQEDKILLEEDVDTLPVVSVDLRQAVIYSEILNRPYV
jgi:hypothetical protein